MYYTAMALKQLRKVSIVRSYSRMDRTYAAK